MQKLTIQKLNELNKRFYQSQAQSFSDTREMHWPGWEKLAKIIKKNGEGRTEDVLDAGCGNGRFLGFMKEQGIEIEKYLGVDSSIELIKIATARYSREVNAKFRVLDILEEQGLGRIEQDFDLIVAFGLLHHIPGFETRLNLLKNLVKKLNPGGQIAITFWQFRKSQRFDKMILESLDVDKDVSELFNDFEKGDHLLDWDKSGLPRYCHNFSDKEIDKLTAELEPTGVNVVADFSADGKEGNLNRYVVFRLNR